MALEVWVKELCDRNPREVRRWVIDFKGMVEILDFAGGSKMTLEIFLWATPLGLVVDIVDSLVTRVFRVGSAA